MFWVKMYQAYQAYQIKIYPQIGMYLHKLDNRKWSWYNGERWQVIPQGAERSTPALILARRVPVFFSVLASTIYGTKWARFHERLKNPESHALSVRQNRQPIKFESVTRHQTKVPRHDQRMCLVKDRVAIKKQHYEIHHSMNKKSVQLASYTRKASGIFQDTGSFIDLITNNNHWTPSNKHAPAHPNPTSKTRRY